MNNLSNQKEREALEQEIESLSNSWFSDHLQEEFKIEGLQAQNKELKELLTLTAEFIGEHGLSHEFQVWMREKRDGSK